MMHDLLAIPCVLLGALTFRIRGGLTEGWRYQLRGQLARLTWAAACAATVWIGAGWGAWWVALLVLPLAFAATILGLWGTIDMGHNQGSFVRDFTLGHLHGLLMGAAITVPLAWAHYGCALPAGLEEACPRWRTMFPFWYVPLLGGAAWAVCYASSWLRPDWPELRRTGLGKYGNPPEAAELLFGAEFALALFFAAGP